MIPGETFYRDIGERLRCKTGESKMENLQLTAHFQSDEFWCSCGCGKEGPNGNKV